MGQMDLLPDLTAIDYAGDLDHQGFPTFGGPMGALPRFNDAAHQILEIEAALSICGGKGRGRIDLKETSVINLYPPPPTTPPTWSPFMQAS